MSFDPVSFDPGSFDPLSVNLCGLPGKNCPGKINIPQQNPDWPITLICLVCCCYPSTIVCSLYFMSVLDSCRLVHISSSILLVSIEMSFILTETDLYLGRIISSNSADRFPNLKTLDSVSVISSDA